MLRGGLDMLHGGMDMLHGMLHGRLGYATRHGNNEAGICYDGPREGENAPRDDDDDAGGNACDELTILIVKMVMATMTTITLKEGPII